VSGFYIYSDKKELASELIGFARTAGKEAFVITFDKKDAEEINGAGADKVYIFEGESSSAENYGRAVAEFLRKENAELFVVGATPRGRDLGARVAGYLDCGMVGDVASLSYADGKAVAAIMVYGGSVIQSAELEGLGVITVPAGKFEAPPAGGAAEAVEIDVQADERVNIIGSSPVPKEGVNIEAAEKLVCVGMGLDKEEDLQMVRGLADAIGAEIGCTRGIAEEKHWLPVPTYIGMSGAVVKPNLYISMGVSGQVQHVVGIRDSKIIVAVDSNENALIFKAADYGIVGDMHEVIPLLTEGLKKQIK
jgi:electron transfer flavoprotein alpha subunit